MDFAYGLLYSAESRPYTLWMVTPSSASLFLTSYRHLSPACAGECFAAVPYCTINELPRGSIDHSWLLLRWALLWAPPGLAFRHESPGTQPSVDLSDDSKVGVPASAERSLWEWIFSSSHPRFHWAGCISTVRASMTTRPRPGGKSLQGSRDMLTFHSRGTPAE